MSLRSREGEFNHIHLSYYSQNLIPEFLSSFLVTTRRILEISNCNHGLAQRHLRLCRRAIRTAKLFNHIYNNQNLTSVFPTFFSSFLNSLNKESKRKADIINPQQQFSLQDYANIQLELAQTDNCCKNVPPNWMC